MPNCQLILSSWRTKFEYIIANSIAHFLLCLFLIRLCVLRSLYLSVPLSRSGSHSFYFIVVVVVVVFNSLCLASVFICSLIRCTMCAECINDALCIYVVIGNSLLFRLVYIENKEIPKIEYISKNRYCAQANRLRNQRMNKRTRRKSKQREKRRENAIPNA